MFFVMDLYIILTLGLLSKDNGKKNRRFYYATEKKY